jgi:hypothetical protein
LEQGQTHIFEWQIPDLDGAPVSQIGLELCSEKRADGVLVLDALGWDGAPKVTFKRPVHNGTMWARAWVNAADHFEQGFPEAFRLVQDHGTGMLIQGGRDWQNYQVWAVITPHMVKTFGLAVRVQGLERFYELQLDPAGKVRLVKALDGIRVLAEQTMAVQIGSPYELRIDVKENLIVAFVNNELIFEVQDSKKPLVNGGIALVVEEGRVGCDEIHLGPLER